MRPKTLVRKPPPPVRNRRSGIIRANLAIPGGTADKVLGADPRTGARVVHLSRHDTLDRLLREKTITSSMFNVGRDFQSLFHTAMLGPHYARSDSDLIVRDKYKWRDAKMSINVEQARRRIVKIKINIGELLYNAIHYIVGCEETFEAAAYRLRGAGMNIDRKQVKGLVVAALDQCIRHGI